MYSIVKPIANLPEPERTVTRSGRQVKIAPKSQAMEKERYNRNNKEFHKLLKAGQVKEMGSTPTINGNGHAATEESQDSGPSNYRTDPVADVASPGASVLSISAKDGSPFSVHHTQNYGLP